jgi:hypothetical protein
MVADRTTIIVGAAVVIVVREFASLRRIAGVIGTRIVVVAGDGGTNALTGVAMVVAGTGALIVAGVVVVRGIRTYARI